jgi:hypothetical protein
MISPMQDKKSHAVIIVLPHEMSVDEQQEYLQILEQVQIPSQYYLEFHPEKNVFGIDDAKRLIAAISQKADHLTTHIIYTAHTMTTEAQNALLKTLEEPPSQARIALLTWKPLALQQTIRSRCVFLSSEETNTKNKTTYGPSFHELMEIATAADLGKALALSESVAKDKTVAAQWCESLLSEQSDMSSAHSTVSATSLQISHSLIELLHNLNANVNTKLAADRFFLSFCVKE